MPVVMFEWDEAKREWTLAERELDFLDAGRLWIGREWRATRSGPFVV